MPPKELSSNCTVRPSVRPASCPVHISYILWGRNSKFGVWMHLGMGECRIPFSDYCDLDLWLSYYSNHNVRPSVRPASCPVHISYILWGRNSKFDVWMHLGMGECRIPFSDYCDLDLWLSYYSNHNVRPSVPLRVLCISPVLFEVGIPNLMCGCILGWQRIAYHFRVTVTLTLTYDLFF